MKSLDDYLRRIELVEIPNLLRDLAPLESGIMRLGSRTGDGPWIDETADRIKHIKESINTYEKIAAALRARETP